MKHGLNLKKKKKREEKVEWFSHKSPDIHPLSTCKFQPPKETTQKLLSQEDRRHRHGQEAHKKMLNITDY